MEARWVGKAVRAVVMRVVAMGGAAMVEEARGVAKVVVAKGEVVMAEWKVEIRAA